MSDRPTILAIDPSIASTALCIIRPGEPAWVDTFESGPSCHGVAARMTRFDMLARRIESAIRGFVPDEDDRAEVFIEGYAYGAKCNRETLGEFGGILRLRLVTLGMSPIEVAPSQLKKFVTGKGNAEKSQMIGWVLKRWGYHAANDDCADAYGLARLGECYLGIAECSTEAQRDVIAGLTGTKARRLRKVKA